MTPPQPPAKAAERPPFVDVPLRERFFQASAFFPMPVVVVSTRGPDGATNLAPYSLCFPHIVGDRHAMVLVVRRDAKTAANIARTGLVAINFIPDDPALLDNCRVLSRAVPTAEKMAQSVFTLLPSRRPAGADAATPPDLVAEAVQIFECTLDRSEPDALGPDERRFVLTVDRILLQPRWHAALEAGRGCPRLPVDYGFRRATDSWLSRPRVAVSGPRLRPRFEIAVARAPGDVAAAFAEALARPDAAVVGASVGEHVQLSLSEERRTYWSPQLDLRLEPHDGGTIVRGRIGPHPSVWTLFTALHLAVAFSGVGGLMWGISQALAREPSWALWAVPIALCLHAFIAGAAFIGQGLGADQTYQLRTFLDDVLDV